ncbi:hypothetical protein F6Y05_38650 [Bacillus megaterium]|nr:hypothetical protein [Priestia megaterium]
MERGYLFLTSGYRVILALVSISIFWSIDSKGITEEKMIMAAIFGGYALVFSIFGNKRVISYLEWLVVLVLAYYTPALLIVYFLLLTPFLQIISLKAKFYDFSLFGDNHINI